MEGPSVACNVDPTTTMAKIFCFDDGTPISFALMPHSAMVEAAIQSVGGQVTSMSKAHFKVYTGREPFEFSTSAPEHTVIDVGWIENCINATNLEPIYPYLLLQSASGLTGLDSIDSPSGQKTYHARDMGELIKAIVACNGNRKRAYVTLHEQYPHKSSLQWEELHKGHRSQIKQALSMIEIRMKTQIEATLCRHLVSADVPSILTSAKSRAGRDDVSVSTLASSKFFTQKPRASLSAIVKYKPQASGVVRRRTSSGVPMTDEHLENLANFLVERKEVDAKAGYPTMKEWHIFKEKYDNQDIRSVDAWRNAFRKKIGWIIDVANKECRARNLSGYSLPPNPKSP